MLDKRNLFGFAKRPISRLKSYWRHELYWPLQKSLFERRHLRRLLPIVLLSGVLTFVWCALVLVIAISLGGRELIFHPGFVQNIIASLAVLPIGIAVGVVIGTLLQKHSLRFQARHAGDNLGDCVGLEIFKFILFLKKKCDIAIDLEGPVDHILVQRARETTIKHLASTDYKPKLPSDFEDKLYETVSGLLACFKKSMDLRLAFPHSFDLSDRLESTIEDIKKGRSSSSPENTSLIVLHFASQMIQDLR